MMLTNDGSSIAHTYTNNNKQQNLIFKSNQI
jgi:hypothetical protein